MLEVAFYKECPIGHSSYFSTIVLQRREKKGEKRGKKGKTQKKKAKIFQNCPQFVHNLEVDKTRKSC